MRMSSEGLASSTIKPRLQWEIVDALGGLQKIRMDPVAETSGARGRGSQRVNGTGRIASFFEQFPSASLRGILAEFGQPRGQFPGERLKRGTVLSHDRKTPIRGQRHDREIIELVHGVVNLRRLMGREFNLPRDDVDPRSKR